MPGLLDAAAEAVAQAQLELLLPDVATIRRVTQTSDGHGGWTDSEADFATGVPCRVDKDHSMDHETTVAGRLTAAAAYVIMLSALPSRWPGGVVDIRAADRIVVTGIGTHEVVGPGGPHSDQWVRETPVLRIEV